MDSKSLILKVAKEEFIKRGYQNTSLRIIAKKCHISATAIYRHFTNKEAIFLEVIAPFMDYFDSLTSYIKEKDMSFVDDNNASKMWAFEEEECFHYKLLFGLHHDLVKLIIKEKRAWFKEFLINYEIEETTKYLSVLKSHGYVLNVYNEASFRVLLEGYIESYFSLLEKNIPKEEIYSICKEIKHFYTKGFQHYFGF